RRGRGGEPVLPRAARRRGGGIVCAGATPRGGGAGGGAAVVAAGLAPPARRRLNLGRSREKGPPMSVYTEVDDDALRVFVAQYDLGEVLSFKGIAEGIENSNFMLTTERGQFILTLYEKRVTRAQLPFFIGLMDHLAGEGITCPTPVRRRDGEAIGELCGRPAAIVTFLNGMWPRRDQLSDDPVQRAGAARLAGIVRGVPGARRRGRARACRRSCGRDRLSRR